MHILSANQKAVYDWIVDFINREGRSPVTREICEAFGFKSTATAHGYLVKLRNAGLLTRGTRNSLIQLPEGRSAAPVATGRDLDSDFEHCLNIAERAGWDKAVERAAEICRRRNYFSVEQEILLLKQR